MSNAQTSKPRLLPVPTRSRMARQIGNVRIVYINSQTCAPSVQALEQMYALGTGDERRPNVFTILPGKPSPSTSSMKFVVFDFVKSISIWKKMTY
jgi:hypothetical protein